MFGKSRLRRRILDLEDALARERDHFNNAKDAQREAEEAAQQANQRFRDEADRADRLQEELADFRFVQERRADELANARAEIGLLEQQVAEAQRDLVEVEAAAATFGPVKNSLKRELEKFKRENVRLLEENGELRAKLDALVDISDETVSALQDVPTALDAARWLDGWSPGCAIGTANAATYVREKCADAVTNGEPRGDGGQVVALPGFDELARLFGIGLVASPDGFLEDPKNGPVHVSDLPGVLVSRVEDALENWTLYRAEAAELNQHLRKCKQENGRLQEELAEANKLADLLADENAGVSSGVVFQMDGWTITAERVRNTLELLASVDVIVSPRDRNQVGVSSKVDQYLDHCTKQAEAEPEDATDLESWMDQKSTPGKTCPHGEDPAECQACFVAGDFAFDAARER